MADFISNIKGIHRLYDKTYMYFLDVICTEKYNIDRGDIYIAFSDYIFILDMSK
jgi:hypothetical protein